MPRPRRTNQPPNRTPLLNTRLSTADYIKLEQVCRAEGKTKTEILREVRKNLHRQIIAPAEERAKDSKIDLTPGSRH